MLTRSAAGRIARSELPYAYGLVALLATSPAAIATQVADVLIEGGVVYDGSGSPGVHAAVGIRDAEIVLVGDARHWQATIVIDAHGLAVAPGFIDSHTHAAETARDVTGPFFNEQAVTQGVTTMVIGADGHWSPSQISADIQGLRTQGSGINFACYVGQGGIRREVMATDRRMPGAAEMRKMEGLVRQGMEMGCVGLATGLQYEPGSFSDTAEVIALASVVRPYDGIYDSHTRDPVKRMVESEREAIDIGAAAGIPAKLAHLKAVGPRNAGRIDEIITLVEAARARGQHVVADQYPYDGAGTLKLWDLFVLPDEGMTWSWSRERVIEKLRAALADPTLRVAVRDATENGVDGGFSWIKVNGDYGAIRIVAAPDEPALVGKSLAALASAKGREPFELLVELVLNARGAVTVTNGSIEERDVRELMVQPWVMIASDGDYPDPSKPGDEQTAHPRHTGTFTRVLGHYSRDLKLFPLEEAIRKMTSLPAQTLRLSDRGRIAPGYAADIVVFDPKAIRDRSTFADPYALSQGVLHVLVNGQFALRDGKLTRKTPGRFVRRQTPRAIAAASAVTTAPREISP